MNLISDLTQGVTSHTCWIFFWPSSIKAVLGHSNDKEKKANARVEIGSLSANSQPMIICPTKRKNGGLGPF